MKTKLNHIRSIAQLIRLPNLLIIVLTQLLLRYCIIIPVLYQGETSAVTHLADFLMLVAITVLVAAGGYVINDYFDVKIDRINRPDRQVVDKVVSPRGAILAHIVLNAVAILLGLYLAWRVRAITFGLIFPFLSAVLWIYSAKYKRVTFWGNFIVSLLSGFVILVVWLFEFFWLRLNGEAFAAALPGMGVVNRIILGYALFAFLVSLVREIIKDMEDTEGDRTFGCSTLPLVIGTERTRYVAGAIIMVTILLMGYAQLVIYRLGMMMTFWYFTFTVQAGAIYLLILLFRAREKKEFHYLSTLCKVIMLAGILSMEIIYINI